MACRNKPFNGAVSLLQDLARRSLDLFEGLIAEEGLHFDYGRRGLLNVYTTDAGFRKGLAEADLLGKHGLAPVTLDAHQARKLEPALSESIVGGVYYPDDAQGDCYSFVRQLSDVIRKLGVEIYTQTTVKGWSTDRSALIRIKTSKGDCCAKNLVIAAGSWSSAFYRDLGMRMPLQPGKGYSLTIDAPSVCPRIPLMNVERKVAITPIDRKLRFAGTMEFAGYNLSLNQNRVDSVLRDGEMVISKIENPKNIENWCGLRPCTPDGLPIIGRVSAHQNVYISTGHGMLGFTLGPISGQLLSKAILRRGSQTSLIHLGLDRF
jgi:D-amino-acid dehydrogenase